MIVLTYLLLEMGKDICRIKLYLQIYSHKGYVHLKFGKYASKKKNNKEEQEPK